MSVKKNIAVIFGGISVEHDISIITGVQTANALSNDKKYNIFPVYIDKQGKWLFSKDFFDIKFFKTEANIKKAKIINFCVFNNSFYFLKGKKQKFFVKIDFVFLATHGGSGENGALQGFFDVCALPCSSSILGSAVCMNKIIAKKIIFSEGINITKFSVLNESDVKKGEKHIFEKIKDLKFPLIVKPCSLGSSVGVNFCKSKKNLKNAITFALMFDTDVLIEEFVNNLQELNIAVMGNCFNCELSDIEEVVLKKDILTFENKYLNKESASKGIENTLRIIPANIEKTIKEQIKEFSKKAFFALSCRGIVRIDFLVNKETKKVYLNEVNSIPGSFANYLWKTKKYSYFDLLEKVMEYCFLENENQNKKIKNFSSNVLSQFENSEKLNFSNNKF